MTKVETNWPIRLTKEILCMSEEISQLLLSIWNNDSSLFFFIWQLHLVSNYIYYWVGYLILSKDGKATSVMNGTSVYSHIKACRRVLLLIAQVRMCILTVKPCPSDDCILDPTASMNALTFTIDALPKTMEVPWGSFVNPEEDKHVVYQMKLSRRENHRHFNREMLYTKQLSFFAHTYI